MSDSLTNKKPSESYKSLLKVTGDNQTIDSTPRYITDGVGNSTGVRLDNTGRVMANFEGHFEGTVDIDNDLKKKDGNDDIWNTFPERMVYVHNFSRTLINNDSFYLPWSDQSSVTGVLNDQAGFLALDDMELEKMSIRITAHPEVDTWKLLVEFLLINPLDAVTELNLIDLYDPISFEFDGATYNGGHQVVTKTVFDGVLSEDATQNFVNEGQLIFIRVTAKNMEGTHAENPLFITTRWRHKVSEITNLEGTVYVRGKDYKRQMMIDQSGSI